MERSDEEKDPLAPREEATPREEEARVVIDDAALGGGGATEDVDPEGSDVAPVRARAKRSPWRWVRRGMLALLVAGAVAAALLFFAFEPFAKQVVLDEAARRGVLLAPQDVTVTWGKVTLWDTRVRLEGVPDLELQVDWMEVQAEGLRATSVTARGVRGRAASVDAAAQVLAFGRLHAGDLLPATAESIELAVGAPSATPILTLRASEAVVFPGEPAHLRGATIEVPKPRLRVGPLDLVAFARGASVEIGVGETLEGAPLHASADFDARRLELSLRRAPAATLATLLGRRSTPGEALWPGDFAIEAKGLAEWTADPRGDLTGRIDATLFGLVPPRPAELAGIVFGNDTKVGLRFRTGPASDGVALETLAVAVGSLRLEGHGKVVPRGDSFDATATLRGPIPCADLVGSAAVAKLGLPLGSGLGALAQQGIGGNVDLRLELRVDGDRLATPEIRPSASIHCRLRLFGG